MTKMVNRLTRSFQQQLVYRRKHGFLQFCKHILVDFVHYHEYAVFEGDLSRQVPEIKAKIPVMMRFLSENEADIDRLVDFWVSRPQYSGGRRAAVKTITGRLSTGDKCFIAEYAGKIIYMDWLGFPGAHVFQPYESKRGLGEGEVLIFGTYCAPAYRGNNLMGLSGYKIVNILKNQGYTRCISYVHPDNHASIKNSERYFGKPTKRLHHWNILGLNLSFLSKEK
jgi:RimJ/RimL family protein N-acetyltransferase